MLRCNLFAERSFGVFINVEGLTSTEFTLRVISICRKWSKFIVARLLRRSSTHRMKLWCFSSIFHCWPKLNSELLDDVWPFCPASPPPLAVAYRQLYLLAAFCLLSSPQLSPHTLEYRSFLSAWVVWICGDIASRSPEMTKLNLGLPFRSALSSSLTKATKLLFLPFLRLEQWINDYLRNITNDLKTFLLLNAIIKTLPTDSALTVLYS